MSEKMTVGELVYKISGDMDNLKTELKKAEQSIGKLEKSMERSKDTTKSWTTQLFSLKTAFVGFITGTLARGIFTLAQSGAELDALSQSFRKLSSSIGLDSEEILGNLKRFSGGTVSNKDLILSANRALTLGVATNMDEFNVLMQTARIRAQDMGLSVTQAFDNIVTGVGRGSPLILDNLGFIVSATQATEDYAKELGIAADQLTEAQKKEALKASILRQGREEIERMGEVTATYADRLAQASTFVTNLKDNIGRALLPAMASLLDANLEATQSMDMTTAQVNELGKRFYQFGQGILVVSRIVKNFYGVMKLIASAFVVSVTTVLKTLLQLGGAIEGLLGISTEGVEANIKAIEGFNNALLDNAIETKDGMVENTDELMKSLKEAYDPQNYKGLSDGELASMMNKTAEASTAVGESAEDAAKKVEEFQTKIVSLTDSAKKAREEVEGKLGEKFKEFSDSIQSNVQDTVTGLAQIVIGAEEEIKKLKESLKDTDDSGDRKEIRSQIKEQEAILKQKEDFEERQAERIALIRGKLEEAGIDATKAGLDNLLNVRNLEEQIEEDRRIASLDEFARFEEEQSKKLLLLTDGFITETKILQEKVDIQKQYEADLTAYLLSEDSKRLENTDAWATATIAKYQEVADAMRNLMSTQSRIDGLSLATQTPPAADISRPPVTTTNNTTNNNVTAPVTINGQGVQNFSANELSAVLGFELNKFIR